MLTQEQHIEFMSIERDLTRPTVDPYKFSVAMLTYFRKKIYITLTNYEFEFNVGFKRDWIALVEGINEGIRIFEEEIETMKKIKDGMK